MLEAVTARGYVFVEKVKGQDQPEMMIYGVSFWRHQLYGRVHAWRVGQGQDHKYVGGWVRVRVHHWQDTLKED